MGHSFLSFELASGSAYTLSIEARREVGETYSAPKGMFNQFDLWYGQHRARLPQCVTVSGRPSMNITDWTTPEEAQAVFKAVAADTARIAESPQFYNTLTANCTNLLAKPSTPPTRTASPTTSAGTCLDARCNSCAHKHSSTRPSISIPIATTPPSTLVTTSQMPQRPHLKHLAPPSANNLKQNKKALTALNSGRD